MKFDLNSIDNKRDYYLITIIVIILSFTALIKDKYILDIFISTLYVCIVASAWNIFSGYTGLMSLGHSIFIGIGQYTSTLIFINLSISPWIGVFIGAIFAVFISFFVGIMTFKLKHYYFALSTIALNTIMHVLAIKLDNITGGSVGINIPFRPSFTNMIFKNYQSYLIMFLILLFFVLISTKYIEQSKLGINLKAIKEDDIAAASMGINVLKTKLITLSISAFFTSITGTLFVQYTLFVDPEGAFSLELSIKAAMLSLIGGIGTLFGPLLGGVILGPIERFLRSWLGSTYSGVYLIIYGILIIIVVYAMPNGLYGKLTEIINKIKKKDF